jgi:hypothetical protein
VDWKTFHDWLKRNRIADPGWVIYSILIIVLALITLFP